MNCHGDNGTELSEDVLSLLRGPNPAFVTTVMPDGSPQITQTWIDTDGTHVLVNTPAGFQKARNVERDPRVAVAIADAAALHRYVAVRGRVVDATTEGAAEHIEKLAQRYLGGPYPWYGGRGQIRLILVIQPSSIHAVG